MIHLEENEKVLVSACLAGRRCSYNKDKHIGFIKGMKFINAVNIAPICPEVDGGLPTPRYRGYLNEEGRVVAEKDRDYTNQCRRGANIGLGRALESGITKAIMKNGTTCCGCGLIPAGLDNPKALKEGDGLLTALLKANGIEVYDETYIDEFIAAGEAAKKK